MPLLSVDRVTLLHDPNNNILTVAPTPFPAAPGAAASDRIFESLRTVAKVREQESDDKLLEVLLRLEKSLTKPTRIAFKLKGKIVFLEPGQVSAIEAARNRVLVHLQSGSLLIRESIASMANKLEPYAFVQIHRSVLVNSGSVEEIRLARTGDHWLRLTGGKEYPISRSFRRNLKMFAPL